MIQLFSIAFTLLLSFAASAGGPQEGEAPDTKVASAKKASTAKPLYSPERLPVTGPAPGWAARKPQGEKPTRSNLQGLVDLKRWPVEPGSPSTVDEATFVEAMGALCPRSYRPAGRAFAPMVLKWAAHFDVDPFTVGALVYWRSNCRAKYKDEPRRGLAAIDYKMHSRHLRDRQYHYQVIRDGHWVDRVLALPAFGFWPGNLKRTEPSIYFVAAFLKVAEAQCADLDHGFGSIAHRHPVSHLFWGDRVKGTDAEDRVLTARRRLLAAYGVWSEPTLVWDGLTIQSPLGGAPRKVTSDIGDNRDGGRRRHKGVDFASDRGEPVYAIADGVVAVAGPQMKRGVTPNIKSREARKIPRKDLARGGLFVMIDHDGPKRSAYMHLDTYVVRKGETVKRGQIIGTVGRSGLKDAHAHLHFELRKHVSRTVRDEHLPPLAHLGSLAIPPTDTWRGRRLQRRPLRK